MFYYWFTKEQLQINDEPEKPKWLTKMVVKCLATSKTVKCLCLENTFSQKEPDFDHLFMRKFN